MIDQLLPAQVAIEGAQTRHLALKRGRSAGRPIIPALGQLGDKIGQLGRGDSQRRESPFGQEGFELLQI